MSVFAPRRRSESFGITAQSLRHVNRYLSLTYNQFVLYPPFCCNIRGLTKGIPYIRLERLKGTQLMNRMMIRARLLATVTTVALLACVMGTEVKGAPAKPPSGSQDMGTLSATNDY